jgi:hypothetical protein
VNPATARSSAGRGKNKGNCSFFAQASSLSSLLAVRVCSLSLLAALLVAKVSSSYSGASPRTAVSRRRRAATAAPSHWPQASESESESADRFQRDVDAAPPRRRRRVAPPPRRADGATAAGAAVAAEVWDLGALLVGRQLLYWLPDKAGLAARHAGSRLSVRWRRPGLSARRRRHGARRRQPGVRRHVRRKRTRPRRCVARRTHSGFLTPPPTVPGGPGCCSFPRPRPPASWPGLSRARVRGRRPRH